MVMWFVYVVFVTVKECVQNLSQEDDKENLVASLWGAERCLRVLESVSTALSSWVFFSKINPGVKLKEKSSWVLKAVNWLVTLTMRNQSYLTCHWSKGWTKSVSCNFLCLVSLSSLSLYSPLLLILFLFHLLPTGDSAEPRKSELLDCLQRLTTHCLLCQVSQIWLGAIID